MSIPVAIRRFIKVMRNEAGEPLAFFRIHCRPVSVSFQVKYGVDKQESAEYGVRHFIFRSLSHSFRKADDYLSAPLSRFVRKDVRYVRFTAQRLIKTQCLIICHES